jgi:hypothetical protein
MRALEGSTLAKYDFMTDEIGKGQRVLQAEQSWNKQYDPSIFNFAAIPDRNQRMLALQNYVKGMKQQDKQDYLARFARFQHYVPEVQ